MIEEPVPFAVRTTLAGLKATLGSTRESDEVVSDGATEAERFTVPARLCRLLRVIVAAPEDPTGTVMVVGLADMLKSGGGRVMARVTSRVWVTLPLVPFRITDQ
jgi:hypothetical protein